MKLKKLNIPDPLRVILLIFSIIWLIWSHHAICYSHITNKFVFKNPIDTNIDTYGSQWPCTLKKIMCKKCQIAINAGLPLLQHYVAPRTSLLKMITCTGVCAIGRLGCWFSIIVFLITLLPIYKIQANKHVNDFACIIYFINIMMSLISGNFPLFIRSIPAYVILGLLLWDTRAKLPRGVKEF